MFETLIEIDKQIFLFLNSLNREWIDPLMLMLSSYISWTIIFSLLGLLIFLSEKKFKVVAVLFYIGSVATSTLVTNILKLIIQRPRPIHEQNWQGIIHDIEKYSAAYSFFSSHAATTFCIAMFVLLSVKTKRFIGILAVLWAFGVSYSRIYVGKHYPGDVLVGILFGSLIGYIGYIGYRLFCRYATHKESLPS